MVENEGNSVYVFVDIWWRTTFVLIYISIDKLIGIPRKAWKTMKIYKYIVRSENIEETMWLSTDKHKYQETIVKHWKSSNLFSSVKLSFSKLSNPKVWKKNMWFWILMKIFSLYRVVQVLIDTGIQLDVVDEIDKVLTQLFLSGIHDGRTSFG